MKKFAQSIPVIAAFALSPSIVHAENTETKTDFIQQQLSQQADHSWTWQWGWFGFLGGTAVAQAVGSQVIDEEERDMRYDMRVGAVKSFLGATDMLLNPMKTHRFAEELANMPTETAEQKEEKLAAAEKFLEEAAKREAYEQSWVNHTLSGVVNLAGGALIAFDDDRPAAGLLDFAVGMLTSEIKIYTAPDTLNQTLAAYKRGDYESLTTKTAKKAATPKVQQWDIAAFGSNVSMSYQF